MPRTNVPPGPDSLKPSDLSASATGMSSVPAKGTGVSTSASKHRVAWVAEFTDAETTSGLAVWSGGAPPWTDAEAQAGRARAAAASRTPARLRARLLRNRLQSGWGKDGANCVPSQGT